MKRTLFRDILIYLLQPEDSSAAASRGYSTARSGLENDIVWLGPMKFFFWWLVAIVAPICFAYFSQ